MKHRNVMAVIFYSILTLGIYDLFWLVRVKKELNAKTRVHVPSLWLLFAPMLLMVLFVVIFVAQGISSPGTPPSAVANIVFIVMYLVAFLAILPITFFWFFKFSKGVHAYTNGELSTAITFLLLYMLRFIGIAIIQDKFNDMLENGTTPAAMTATNGYVPQPNPGMPPSAPMQQIVNPAPQVPPANQWNADPAPQQPIQTGGVEQYPDTDNTPQSSTPPSNPIA